MSLTRRRFLLSAAAGGAVIIARPLGALAEPLDPGLSATSRVSRLFPAVRLVHGDLHNHTVRSDGKGDPAMAFVSMRAAGLDFAALTDHTTVSKAAGPASSCTTGCGGVLGVNEASWAEALRLADAENRDDDFAAIRGFEWSSPQLGHVNVWFGKTWVDPIVTGGVDATAGTGQFLHEQSPPMTAEQTAAVAAALADAPTTDVSILGFQDWLKADPDRPGTGGGRDSIAGFNHPGRELGRYGQFAFDPALRQQLVSIEVFNRGEDYLFEGIDNGAQSPISQCLDAGWQPGLIGVSDEHGTNWGTPENNGRTGLYVASLSRPGVRAAMESRRLFASRLRGLRMDAAANGMPMGGPVPHESGPMTFTLDIDRGVSWYGRRLNVQVLQSPRAGEPLPRVVQALTVTVPSPDQPVITFEVPISATDGGWVILRISDPASTDTNPGSGNKSIVEDGRARGTAFEGLGPAIAYASPFYLTAAAPAPVVPEAPAAVLLPAAAALGLGAAYAYGRKHSHDEDHTHVHTHGSPA